VDDVAAALRLLCCQLVPGTLVDQQFDERQPLRLVDRFGEQFSVTRIVESRILLIHSRAPALAFPKRTVSERQRPRNVIQVYAARYPPING
jgi:hypothetical protein